MMLVHRRMAFTSLQLRPLCRVSCPFTGDRLAFRGESYTTAGAVLACRLLVAKTQSSHELLGIGEVGVWVAAPKIFLGVAVQQRALRCSQLLQKCPA